MKLLFLLLLLFLMYGCNDSSNTSTQKVKPIANQFEAVWREVSSDKLDYLPQESVSYEKLFDAARDYIMEDASRTLVDTSDILEPFDKLVHPNGVCLKGIWQIDTPNIYSGYFKDQSKALIIARVSSAMSNTKRGEIRAFGLAGKLFPTTDSLKINREHSANFFVIDDLGGTKAEQFRDVALTNEPEISTNSEVVKYLLYSLKVAAAFKESDENPNIRQLYEISQLAEANNSLIITPKWMKIEAQEAQRANAEDFRDEFKFVSSTPIVFDISVASYKIDETKIYSKIGTITFDESVISTSCDHRLHFHHPKWRNNLVYE